MDALLGDGMPWRIIMICFTIGVLSGIKAQKKSDTAEKSAETEK